MQLFPKSHAILLLLRGSAGLTGRFVCGLSCITHCHHRHHHHNRNIPNDDDGWEVFLPTRCPVYPQDYDDDWEGMHPESDLTLPEAIPGTTGQKDSFPILSDTSLSSSVIGVASRGYPFELVVACGHTQSDVGRKFIPQIH